MKIMPTSTFWPGIIINKSSWLNVVSLPNFFLLDTMTNKDDWLYEENIEKILAFLIGIGAASSMKRTTTCYYIGMYKNKMLKITLFCKKINFHQSDYHSMIILDDVIGKYNNSFITIINEWNF